MTEAQPTTWTSRALVPPAEACRPGRGDATQRTHASSPAFDARGRRCYKRESHQHRDPLRRAPRRPERIQPSVTFPELEQTTQSAPSLSRVKRTLVEQAIAEAAAAQWAAAADVNRKLLDYGPDAEAENRLAKSLWEMGDLAGAREHYQKALALDPTNRIAERNIDRLKTLLVEAGDRTNPAEVGRKAPVSIFVEETGKTGFAYLMELARPKVLAQVNTGDLVELFAEGKHLVAMSNGIR